MSVLGIALTQSTTICDVSAAAATYTTGGPTAPELCGGQGFGPGRAGRTHLGVSFVSNALAPLLSQKIGRASCRERV